MFHVAPYGETTPFGARSEEEGVATEYEVGVLVGLLIGEGHFGGDRRQPQITLRMHVRHGAMFRWLERTFPGGRLYGPYDHGGRRYFQWMLRGPDLRELLPLLQERITADLDAYAFERLQQMLDRYGTKLSPRESDVPVTASFGGDDQEVQSSEEELPDSSRIGDIFSRLRELEGE
jgi:hypothetical protein